MPGNRLLAAGLLILAALPGCSADPPDTDRARTTSPMTGPPQSNTAAMQPLVVRTLPKGFALSGAAQLPNTGISPGGPFDAALYSVRPADKANPVLVGIFQRPAPNTPDRAPAVREGLGPKELRGITWTTSGTERLLVARGLDDAALKTLAARADIHDRGTPGGTTRLAFRSHSPVPGIGSLPVPPSVPAFLTAYERRQETQDSIAVGIYAGDENDLRIFDWWFDGPARQAGRPGTYSYPAYESIGGPAVPDAHLNARLVGANVVLTRLVGLTDQEEAAVAPSVTSVAVDQWRTTVASVLPPPSKPA